MKNRRLNDTAPKAIATAAMTAILLSGFLIAFAIFNFGCQTKPTVARETVSRSFGGSQALLGPIALSEDVVIVDTRSSFDFLMARIPRSVSVNWSDYSEREPSQRGWPQKDLFAAARRLARMGIAPDSKVVVLGQGLAGEGEEGRVAWFLAYLGIEDIRFGRFGSVKSRLTTEALPESTKPLFEDERIESSRSLQPPEPPATGKPIWKPQVVSSLIVTREELRGAVSNNAMKNPWAFSGRTKLYRILDVRPAKEYLGQRGGMRSKSTPNFNAVNVPWKEFFTPDFRPLKETGDRLGAIHVAPEHRVIVIDNDGVSACAVTMALRAFGYSDAGCYAGGFNDLLAK